MTPPSTSTLPKLLGYLGLVPFVSLTLFLLFHDYYADVGHHHVEIVRQLLLSYGAVILSFVGALHWSFAMLLHALPAHHQRWSFSWSIVPSLVGWIALAIPTRDGFILLAIFFAIALAFDKALLKSAVLPAWYWPLRRNLTLIAVLCMLTSAYIQKA